MLGLPRKEGFAHKCSDSPLQGWNIVNEDLSLPILIIGLFTKAPREWAPVCSVTLAQFRPPDFRIYLPIHEIL